MNKKQKKKEVETNLSIMDIRNYDDDMDAFMLKDGSYLDFLEVITKDRDNADEDVIMHDVYDLMRFYKLGRNDIKWISMNFPINASKQKEHKLRLYEQTSDPVRKIWLKRHLQEFETVESKITRRESFLMIFGENKDIFMKNRKSALDILGYGKERTLKVMSDKKKLQIVFKLNNMNSLIIMEEENNAR